MFEQAVKLQKAISQAHLCLKSIGRCLVNEFEKIEHRIDISNFTSEYQSASDSESESDFDEYIKIRKKYIDYINIISLNKTNNDNSKNKNPFEIIQKRIKIKNSIIKKSKCDFFTRGFLPGDFNLSVKCKNFNFNNFVSNINQKILKKMYKSADQATFGNLKSMKTEIDCNIRSGREISARHFIVDPKLISKLQKLWCDKFKFANLAIEPYKINLYQKGDFFKRHRDTPSKNMIGTLLINLSQNPNECDDNYHSNDGILCLNNDEYYWNPVNIREWCGFYADIEHEVKPIIGDWIRATLSFKVYANGFNLETIYDEKIDDVQKLISNFPKPYGFILSHKYSLNTSVAKGADNILISAILNSGHKIKRIPVCVKYSGTEDNFIIQVYPLTDECIDYILGINNNEPKIIEGNIEFIVLNEGIKWYDESEPYIEYTGNEAQIENIDSLYLNHAIIIFD